MASDPPSVSAALSPTEAILEEARDLDSQSVEDVLVLLGQDLHMREEAGDEEVSRWTFLRVLEKVEFDSGLVTIERPDENFPEAIEGPREAVVCAMVSN